MDFLKVLKRLCTRRKKKLSLGAFLALSLYVIYIYNNNSMEGTGARTFSVDLKKNMFLKDGKPFRFISGSFHYFRAHPGSWQRKLRTMRAAGLNAVATYVEWSLHNPRDGIYLWNGTADLEKFIQLAVVEDLLVILRPGPYICADRDMGGLPSWLLRKYPDIFLRSSDQNYLAEVNLWYAELMARVSPFLYGNGGPIIMVQVENEYSSYYACDMKYKLWLRDQTLAHVGENAVLFTNEKPTMLQCAYSQGVLLTLDFGSTDNITANWELLREEETRGPLVNTEYYTGGLTHWMEPTPQIPAKVVMNTLVQMLDNGASVNFYMFCGGTNYGFTSGANDGGPGRYQADITSYDYGAPMNEAGDPTWTYFKLREIIRNYLPLPNIHVAKPMRKKPYGTLRLLTCCSILSTEGRKSLSMGTVIADKPMSFEALNQFSGLVLYETDLPKFKHDPSVLSIHGLHDRAYIYVDEGFVGLLSRETPANQLPLSASAGTRLQIVVENQGRISFGPLINDFKGILGYVKLDQQVLHTWNMSEFPLESAGGTEACACFGKLPEKTLLESGPTIFRGVLDIEEGEVWDTYLDTSGWGKGVAFINGVNLGRYWPVTGPQITLFVPRELLQVGKNQVILMEYQSASATAEVQFRSNHIFNDGTNPWDSIP